jgi:hypothetical protein
MGTNWSAYLHQRKTRCLLFGVGSPQGNSKQPIYLMDETIQEDQLQLNPKIIQEDLREIIRQSSRKGDTQRRHPKATRKSDTQKRHAKATRKGGSQRWLAKATRKGDSQRLAIKVTRKGDSQRHLVKATRKGG